MERLEALYRVLDYIESSVCEEISQEEAARHGCMSVSSLQKLFRHCFHISVGDYITRRKMTLAARMLQNDKITVTDCAFHFGYNSPETFTRAFTRVWSVTPTVYREKWSFSGIFPKIERRGEIRDENGGIIMTNKLQYDMTELYDYIRSKDGTYIISFDMVHLMEINEKIGRAAGDAAIRECLSRIDREKDADMLMFRIGGDEFVLLTGTDSPEKAKETANRILAHNEEKISAGNTEFPVSMRAAAMKIDGKKLKYSNLFGKLAQISRPEVCCCLKK